LLCSHLIPSSTARLSSQLLPKLSAHPDEIRSNTAHPTPIPLILTGTEATVTKPNLWLGPLVRA